MIKNKRKVLTKRFTCRILIKSLRENDGAKRKVWKQTKKVVDKPRFAWYTKWAVWEDGKHVEKVLKRTWKRFERLKKLRKKLKKFLTRWKRHDIINKLSRQRKAKIAPCKLNNEMLTLNSMWRTWNSRWVYTQRIEMEVGTPLKTNQHVRL